MHKCTCGKQSGFPTIACFLMKWKQNSIIPHSVHSTTKYRIVVVSPIAAFIFTSGSTVILLIPGHYGDILQGIVNSRCACAAIVCVGHTCSLFNENTGGWCPAMIEVLVAPTCSVALMEGPIRTDFIMYV